MVFRGAWFQRFGPAGCVIPTRQTPASDTAELTRRCARCSLSHAGKSDRTQAPDVTQWKKAVGIQRARVAGREGVTYVMGILGNRDWPRSVGRDAACLYDYALLQRWR